MSITIYSKSGCPQCVFTKKYLETQNVEFTEKRVDRETTFLDEVKLLGYRSLPVVTDGVGNSFSGYNPEMLEALVDQWHR